MIKYSRTDEVLFNPEAQFSPSQLESMEPYHIFTGEGFVLEELEYDEEDNDVIEETFFHTKMELREYVNDNEIEDYSVREVFFAKVVQQRSIV